MELVMSGLRSSPGTHHEPRDSAARECPRCVIQAGGIFGTSLRPRWKASLHTKRQAGPTRRLVGYCRASGTQEMGMKLQRGSAMCCSGR